MKLNELLDSLKNNPKVNNDIYRIDVKGIKNNISYGNGTQTKLRKRISESVLNMQVIGYVSDDNGCHVRVDDIHEEQQRN